MTLRERVLAAIERAEETGLARTSYPVTECRPAEHMTFLLSTAVACLRLDELAADPDYDLLRISGPDAPRQAAFDDLTDDEKRAVLAVENSTIGWERSRPKVPEWLAKLETMLAEAECTTS